MRFNRLHVASLTIVIMLLCLLTASAQDTGKRKKRPTPKNQQEVIKMEGGSDHDVEWHRNEKTGQLEATGKPPNVYKSPLGSLKNSSTASKPKTGATAPSGKTASSKTTTTKNDNLYVPLKETVGRRTGTNTGRMKERWIIETIVLGTGYKSSYEFILEFTSDGNLITYAGDSANGLTYTKTGPTTYTHRWEDMNTYGIGYKYTDTYEIINGRLEGRMDRCTYGYPVGSNPSYSQELKYTGRRVSSYTGKN